MSTKIKLNGLPSTLSAITRNLLSNSAHLWASMRTSEDEWSLHRELMDLCIPFGFAATTLVSLEGCDCTMLSYYRPFFTTARRGVRQRHCWTDLTHFIGTSYGHFRVFGTLKLYRMPISMEEQNQCPCQKSLILAACV